MIQADLRDLIYRVITEEEPVTTKEIQAKLNFVESNIAKDSINSILYGELKKSVIRDVNSEGIPAWKVRRAKFTPAGGLELKFYDQLLKKGIINKENSQHGFGVKNTKNNKRYHLDIAVFINSNRYNIEIDGFDHIRADALSSMDRQLDKKGHDCEIEIDWMDHEKSYVSYSNIDTSKVYKWCGKNIDWCIKYHEELLWPKDITRNIWLIDKGWCVIRLWNEQVRAQPEKCMRTISDWLES